MLSASDVGDFNCDNQVNFGDFLVLSENFGATGVGATPDRGDANGDSSVNFQDFLILSSNFGSTVQDINTIFDVRFERGTRGELAINERVSLTFSYITDVPAGVELVAIPMTSGSPTPNYEVSPSTLEPFPGANVSRYFTIRDGDVRVDQVKLQMWTEGKTELLKETFVNVNFNFSENAPNRIFDVQINPTSPAHLANKERVNLTFNYITDRSDGVLIAAQPMTGGSLTRGAGFGGSPIYPSPSGNASQHFVISFGDVHVDQVRLRMWSGEPGRSDLLHETFVDVDFSFGTVTYDTISRNYIASSQSILSIDEIDGSDGRFGFDRFSEGTYFMYQTSEGRFGKFIIQEYDQSNNHRMEIDWVTYDLDGSVFSSGTGLSVRGTYFLDLDHGTEVSTDPPDRDFQWKMQTETTRWLSPRNGARFALLYRPSIIVEIEI